MKFTIYLTKKDKQLLDKLKEYAKSNKWSVSLAIRELLSSYFEVKPEPIPIESTINIPPKGTFVFGKKVEPKPTEKMDIAQYEAQIESELAKTDDKQMAECIKEKTNSNGEVSCYFFDNAREHFSFCKQYCWTNEKIWGKRVRL